MRVQIWQLLLKIHFIAIWSKMDCVIRTQSRHLIFWEIRKPMTRCQGHCSS
ncbi:hypothetical protein LOK49_LG02G00443 [Camellia lanceoleosa]|uniref:Uncharacterized protein n=1 Tax=Camellia lanceoleosa TaxID=1840588 RepID=A0ACC0IH80_9ERIC|nr:hypothetical protein LOK49_LG02G00443 [Camellia lanceoleosa]